MLIYTGGVKSSITIINVEDGIGELGSNSCQSSLDFLGDHSYLDHLHEDYSLHLYCCFTTFRSGQPTGDFELNPLYNVRR